MKRPLIILLLIMSLFATGCKRASQANATNEALRVDETQPFEYIVTFTSAANSTPTNTAAPDGSPEPDVTPIATQSGSNSAAPSAATASSAALSQTPSQNITQTATVVPATQMTTPKGDGYYLVGTDISTGKWESQGSGDDCNWTVYNQDGDAEKKWFGFAGGVVNVLSSYSAVEFYDCGEWNYIEGVSQELLPSFDEEKEDGIYTVGVEIAVGLWQSLGTGDECNWSIYDDEQNLLQTYIGDAGTTVDLLPSDYEVLFDGCGTWEFAGP